MELFIYLLINGILYISFGVWCALFPEYTSSAVGLLAPTAQGFTEYVAVYGGLEFGVGMFFVLTVIKPRLRHAGLIFGLCFYGGLALFRTYAICRVGTDIGAAFNFYLAELFFAAWSVRLVWKYGK
jgi:hypothetical protein